MILILIITLNFKLIIKNNELVDFINIRLFNITQPTFSSKNKNSQNKNYYKK